ncbi:hypothetical protein [Aequorivita antarctica]|uniref:DUF4129 domain-containing protein n=1 Tax=Aequorivita antarctica TaxID=153266 RepID=A0A5C6YVX0_9FLAO|nr:hypothetical protein [Aequorivita antarctica]TXD71713.1 hypothetical protein ESU54_15720 [Aequorivita antarctica]SRX75821.1 hypothetical protein AEQU3_02818 [Aequorivita antarctica]
MNRFTFILFFLLNTLAATASGKDSLTVTVDSSKVVQKHFSGNLSEKYSGSDFDYDSVEGEAENFLERAINWFFKKLGEVFGIDISPVMYQIIKFIIYGMLIVFALYILVKLLVGDNASSFFSKQSKMVAPLNIQEEHIENVDLDSYIKNALKEENYRLAIRYMYLKSLKLLSLNNIISWHFEKTNSDYYREIESESLKESFKQASYLYDNIWYGEFALDKAGFENAEKDFERLNQNLKNAG